MTDYEHVMGASADGELIRVIDCTNLDQSRGKIHSGRERTQGERTQVAG